MAYKHFEPSGDTSLEALRRRLRAGMKLVTKVDDNGYAHTMVWIPQFQVTPGLIGSWPTRTYQYGGFFVDAYECCDPGSALPAGPTAVSALGGIPVSDITHTDAKALAASRTFWGVPCKLPSLHQWAALVLIPRILGHTIHGNTHSGWDWRESSPLEGRGVFVDGGDGLLLAGTGPNTWSLTGDAHAPHDVIGNLSEWVDDLMPAACRLAVVRSALVADAGGISAADTQLTIDTIEGYGDAWAWPETNGLIQIGTEFIEYSTYTPDNGTAVLGGLTRGARGTTPAIHADNDAVTGIKEFCLLPGGMCGFVVGLNNTTSPVTFHLMAVKGTPGKASLEVGDIITRGGQVLTVTARSGTPADYTVTATRTGAAAIPDGTGVIVGSVTLTHSFAAQRGLVASFRTDDPDVERLMVPDGITADPTLALDAFELVIESVSPAINAIARGGGFTAAEHTDRFGFSWRVQKGDANVAHNGLRCVFEPPTS